MLIRTIDNFITSEECSHVIHVIDKNNVRSSVVGNAPNSITYDEGRTSSTSNLCDCDSKIFNIKNKIANELKIPIETIEQLQGQVYQPGQFFRPHHDYFNPNDNGATHIGNMGNRTWTCMIYLNDDFKGGETNFPNIDLKFTPKKGMAVVWQNMDKKGKLLEDSLHEGCEVIEGSKYIITAWIREKAVVSLPPSPPINVDSKIYFSHHSQLPRFTELGFKKIKLPSDLWEMALDMYDKVKSIKQEEIFEGKDYIIPGDGEINTSDIFYLDRIPELRTEFHNRLLPLHKEWVNTNIEPSFIYGIRSYNKGAKLTSHRDRIETHHVSSILCIDKDLGDGEDWPLDIQGNDGNWYSICLEPGDLLLYESAICEHGRKLKFEGEFYRNMFIHYKLLDYEYRVE